MEITPSMFLSQPVGSVVNNHETEVVARNVMVILKRTGNTFRELTWPEYERERRKDGNFSAQEKDLFYKVQDLCLGDVEKITGFCDAWKNSYNKNLELSQKNNNENTHH